MTDVTEAQRIALATIPPEAVEAAAIVLMGRLMVSHQDALHVWSGMYEPEKDQSRREAAAALRAGIAAWPGVEVFSIMSDGEESIVLPLPQETRDG